MVKKIAYIIMAFVMLFVMSISGAAISANDAISEIKAKAETDGYRFMLVDKAGIDDEIRNDLAENDSIYLGDAPIGSVNVIVLDADTGKPIKDAQCMLSFSSSRYTVNSDGSHEQIANPFLLFDLGKTPSNGDILFSDTYFYTTSIIDPESPPYAQGLSVGVANLVDKDPEIAIDYDTQAYISTAYPEVYNSIISKLGGKTTLKFSALKTIVEDVSTEQYTEVIRNLFDDGFAKFSNNVMVKVYDKPEFEKLLSSGKQQLTIGELRAYIDDNHDLFVQYVAARDYPDFGGFEPSFVFDYNPEYDYVKTYKDGTQKNETNSAYLGVSIFGDVNSEDGTGHAIITSGFSYRTYVYADGYKEGLAIGSSIRQDFVDKDLTVKVYLSKDVSPLVAYDKTNAIFGSLTDLQDNPIVGATVKIQDTDYKAVTNKDGYFSLMNLKLKDKSIKLTIVNPENGEDLPAAAMIDGKKYALDNIPIDLTGENGIYQLTLVNGMKETGGGTGMSRLVLILLIVAILTIIGVVIAIVLVNRSKKHKCSNCGIELKPGAAFCENCGKRV